MGDDGIGKDIGSQLRHPVNIRYSISISGKLMQEFLLQSAVMPIIGFQDVQQFFQGKPFLLKNELFDGI